MNKTNRRNRVEQGSGNVFRDLGFPHPEREQLKADLTLQIYRLIRQRGLTQAEAGQILRIRQPHVSVLMRGRSGAFSVERLMQFLTALGQDVQVTVRSTRKGQGELSVVVRCAPPSVRLTKRSPYVSLATSVLIRARASPARPAFSAAFIVYV